LNDYLISLILGIVEGLTEFIPVSSTAHLRIAEFLLHINLSDGYWKMYTIVIQLGAILCVRFISASASRNFSPHFRAVNAATETSSRIRLAWCSLRLSSPQFLHFCSRK